MSAYFMISEALLHIIVINSLPAVLYKLTDQEIDIFHFAKVIIINFLVYSSMLRYVCVVVINHKGIISNISNEVLVLSYTGYCFTLFENIRDH